MISLASCRASARRLLNIGRSVLLAVLLAAVLNPGKAPAMSAKQQQLYRLGVYAFDVRVPCSATGQALSREDRYQAAWAFFVSLKGLSPEATAGIMGNLEAESGIDPHNVQNNANANGIPDGPEIPINATGNDGTPFKSHYGYGIAQWTTAGRQQGLVDYAAATTRSTGDLGLQLDYLWKELNERYAGVLAVLQTPDVTVQEATSVFLREFEIPADIEGTAPVRLAKAQSIHNEFKDQTAASETGSCAAPGKIDLASEDTTNIPCSNGTQDAGTADGYRSGKLIRIRLCRVGGALVNSQLAGSIQQMLTDSAAAGRALSINGSFRSMEGQIAIYRGWCARDGITPTPPPYPRPLNEYNRCPGAAPPGYSNHQQGLALDLECNGSLIPMSYSAASRNSCFQWLLSNGIRYNLYEFGKGQNRNAIGYEGWHWSVDGG